MASTPAGRRSPPCLLPDEQAGVRRDARVGPLEAARWPASAWSARGSTVPELLRYLSREHVQVVELKRPRLHGRAQQGQGRPWWRHDGAQGRDRADPLPDRLGPRRRVRPVMRDDNRPPRPQVTLHQGRARPASATLCSPVASPSRRSPVATRTSTIRWASSMQPSGPSSRRSASARGALSS